MTNIARTYSRNLVGLLSENWILNFYYLFLIF